MNMQQPPRAEAVDSSLQGDPATSPFSGGAQAYQAYLASQKMDDERVKREWENKVKEAQISRYERLGNSNASNPETDPDTGMVWNGRQWVFPRQEKKDSWDNAIPIGRGKLDEKGEFTNQYPEAASGDQIQLQTPHGRVVLPYSSWEGRQGPTGAVPEPELPRSAPPATENIATTQPEKQASTKEVRRFDPKSGRWIVFDAETKQPLRYGD
jgi:hypothetical protein